MPDDTTNNRIANAEFAAWEGALPAGWSDVSQRGAKSIAAPLRLVPREADSALQALELPGVAPGDHVGIRQELRIEADDPGKTFVWRAEVRCNTVDSLHIRIGIETAEGAYIAKLGNGLTDRWDALERFFDLPAGEGAPVKWWIEVANHAPGPAYVSQLRLAQEEVPHRYRGPWEP